MDFGTVIQSGIKEIGALWFRSLLTMFGVICGVASLVTMAAFVKGKENLLRESLAETGGRIGFAWLDMSTGEFTVQYIDADGLAELCEEEGTRTGQFTNTHLKKKHIFSIFGVFFILLRDSSRLTDFLKVCEMRFSGSRVSKF